jgi:hypothetical protein
LIQALEAFGVRMNRADVCLDNDLLRWGGTAPGGE